MQLLMGEFMPVHSLRLSILTVCLSWMYSFFLCAFHGEVWASHWLQGSPLILTFNPAVSKQVTKHRGLKLNQILLSLVNQSCSADKPWKGWKELQHLVFLCFIFCRCVCQCFWGFFEINASKYMCILSTMLFYITQYLSFVYMLYISTQRIF